MENNQPAGRKRIPGESELIAELEKLNLPPAQMTLIIHGWYKAMQSYAASTQQGYSLEHVQRISDAFKEWYHKNYLDASFPLTFNWWATETPEGKSLLGERSQPVGVQTATEILKEAWVNANPGADISIFEENVKEDDEVQFVLAAMDNYLAALGRSPWVVYNGDNSSRKTLPFPGKTVYIKYQSVMGLWEREIGDRNHIINLYENGWQEIYWFADESAPAVQGR